MNLKISLDALKALKNQEFRNLITGRFFIILAFKMTSTLLGWWVYELTGDPFSIGLIGLSEVIPAVGCALYAGHFIDMNEKRRLLLICNFAYVILLGAFLGPIVSAMIPKIVSKELLPRAITINQTTFLAASVMGHAMCGFLVSLLQIKGTLVVIVSSLFVAFFFYFKTKPQHSEFKDQEVNVYESIKEGLHYIFKTKEIVGALTLDLFAVLFGGAVALIPVFAKDILQLGAVGYGFLNAASDIGAGISIFTLTFFPLRRNQGKLLLFSVFGFGACILLFGISEYFILSFLALLMSGILDGVSGVIRGTIVQLKTPDHMRGRVMSVNSMFVMSSNELGQFESGVAARLFGAVNAVVIGGSITMLIAVVVRLTSPKLREMEY